MVWHCFRTGVIMPRSWTRKRSSITGRQNLNREAAASFLLPRLLFVLAVAISLTGEVTLLHSIALVFAVLISITMIIRFTLSAFLKATSRSRLTGKHVIPSVASAALLVLSIIGVFLSSPPEANAWALPAGGVQSWGYNYYGQLGDTTTTSKTIPYSQVVGPIGADYLRGIVAIAMSSSHSLALREDGTVWAWGLGESGQLGNGTNTIKQLTPVQVLGTGGAGYLTGVVAIAAGGYHSLALKNDGTVWAWGLN